MLPSIRGLSRPIDQRANPKAVPKRENASAYDHRHDSKRTPTPAEHALYRGEDVVRTRLMALPPQHGMQFMGQDVQQDLGIRARVEVAQVFPEKTLSQLYRVGEITVVAKRQPEG